MSRSKISPSDWRKFNEALTAGIIAHLEYRRLLDIMTIGSNSYQETIEPFFNYIKRQIIKGYQ